MLLLKKMINLKLLLSQLPKNLKNKQSKLKSLPVKPSQYRLKRILKNQKTQGLPSQLLLKLIQKHIKKLI
jgi:hypothetical protein